MMSSHKRFSPLERFLVGFNPDSKRHQQWLEELERHFQLDIQSRGSIRDQDYRASVEVAQWLDSPRGREQLNAIQKRWSRAFPENKKRLSVPMPVSLHSKLERMAKKRKTSKNSMVINLISEAYEQSNGPSIAERFDELKQTIQEERKILTKEFRQSECRKVRLQDGVSYLKSEMMQMMRDEQNVPAGLNSRELWEFVSVVKKFHSYCQQHGAYGDDVID
ncbi:TPA: hypothetical protein JG822_004396 [Vibrio parahaemolyticus]|nr:hypothetical protein [Vibrio parahaemolyticus]